MSTPRAPRTRSSKVSKAAKAGQGNRNVWLIVAVVAVVAFAAVIAVALSQEETDDVATGDAVADVSIEGEALPPTQQEPQGGVGQDAPEVSGTTLQGESLTIGEPGRPQVLAFLAHWCPHCQAEVPRVVEWAESGNAPDDVDIYGISTSVTPTAENYPPGEWLRDEGWTELFPTLVDDASSSTHAAFGAGGFPYFVAVDAEGQVVAQRSGEIGTEALEDLIEQARTGSA